MGLPLYAICYFTFVAFNVLSLCLGFVSLISMCLGIFLFGFILYGTLWASWTWLAIFFSMLGKISTIISSKFSHTLSFSVLILGPLYFECWCIWYGPRGVLRLSSVLFILFTLFCSSEVIFNILPSSSLIHSSASDILLLIPSRVFSISVIVFVCLSFYSLF